MKYINPFGESIPASTIERSTTSRTTKMIPDPGSQKEPGLKYAIIHIDVNVLVANFIAEVNAALGMVHLKQGRATESVPLVYGDPTMPTKKKMLALADQNPAVAMVTFDPNR